MTTILQEIYSNHFLLNEILHCILIAISRQFVTQTNVSIEKKNSITSGKVRRQTGYNPSEPIMTYFIDVHICHSTSS